MKWRHHWYLKFSNPSAQKIFDALRNNFFKTYKEASDMRDALKFKYGTNYKGKIRIVERGR